MSDILCNDSTASAPSQFGSRGECELPSASWNACLEKPPAILDADDDETTDIGHTSGSDTESSSGASSDERHCGLSQRCRFGKTSLGTVPSTPCAGFSSDASPPGLSRAALRHARDSCKTTENGAPSAQCSKDKSDHVDGIHIDATSESSSSCSSSRSCRFSKTMLGTVPKTPVNAAKWKALTSVFGSPPGLSHTEKRRARDACKAPVSEQATSSADGGALVSLVSDKKQTAREQLGRLRQEAALLKDLTQEVELRKGVARASSESGADSADEDMELAGAASEDSSSKAKTCRLSGTAFGTAPPVASDTALVFSSPPGLSRKAMREARDACKAAPTWRSHAVKELMAVNPLSKATNHSAGDTLSQAPR